MTREQAIEIIRQYECNSEHYEACEMAIKALEQEPCENCCNGNQIEKAKLCQKSYLAGMEHKQEPFDDCISRQAAINAAIDGADKWDGGFNREREKCIQEEIEKLTSVTPQPKKGHWIKCIDDNGSSYYLCSVCRCGEDYNFDWCPNCGSKNS